MTSVTVDLNDLETIVMTTAALRTIEGALQQRKDDPFVKPHLNFTAAHDRLVVAMRNAKRVDTGTAVDFNAALETSELAMLREIDAWDEQEGPYTIPRTAKIPEPGSDMAVVDRLAAKGCVQIGQRVTGVMWHGEKPILTIDPDVYIVRMTQRGRDKLGVANKEAAA